MFRSLSISVATLACVLALLTNGSAALAAHPTPTPSPTATPTPPPPEDPAVTRIARREFVSWQAGSIDRTRYTPELAAKATDATVTELSTKLAALGAFVRTEYLGPIQTEGTPPGIHGYMYRMFCTQGTVYVELILDGQNRVAGILFRDKLPS